MMKKINHPAKYTNSLIPVFADMLRGCKRILDPFGGTGKIFLLNEYSQDFDIFCLEIEPEWARMDKRTIQANALCIPFSKNSFDAICTSCTYGNRMADHDKGTISIGFEKRKTYSSALERELHPDNSGSMQWGDVYRSFHVSAWKEATRVLRVGGVFVLNIKNHIRGGVEQLVSEWHTETIISMGYGICEEKKINTPSMRRGANSNLRVGYENVIKFIKEKE